MDEGEGLHGLAHAHAVAEDAAAAAGAVRAVVDAVQPGQTRPLQRAQPPCQRRSNRSLRATGMQQQISGATAAVGRRRRITLASGLILRLCVAFSRHPARHQLAG